MHLVSLSIRNFKKYRCADLEFPNGLIGIVGGNGAGKSTIVEAIAWALYGSKTSNIKRELIKNTYAKENESVQVKLRVNINSQDYIIHRVMKGKSLIPEAKLFSGNRPIAVGSREVDHKIEEILNIGFEDFMKTFYAKQKDLDNLLKEGGIGKREYLLNLLNLDYVREKANEKIKLDQSSLNEQNSRINGALEQIGNVDQNIEEIHRKRNSAQSDLSAYKEKENELVSMVKERRLVLDREIEKKRSHDLLNERITGLELQIFEKNAAIDAEERRLNEIERSKATFVELEPKLLRIKAVRSRLDSLEPIKKEYNLLSQKKYNISAIIDGLRRVLRDIQQKHDLLLQDQSVFEEIKPLEAEYQEISGQYSKLETAREKNSELQSCLNEEKVRLESIENNIVRVDSAKSVLLNMKSRLTDVEPIKENFRELQSQFEEASRQKELQARLDGLKTQRKTILLNKEQFSSQIELLNQKASALGDLDAREAQIRNQDVELDKLNSELLSKITDLKSDLKVYEAKRMEVRKGILKLRDLGPESVCPTCERGLGDQHVHLVKKYEIAQSEAERQTEFKQNEINSNTEKIKGVVSARSRYKKAFDEVIILKRQKAELSAECRSLESQTAENDYQLKRINLDIEALGPVKFDQEHFVKIQNALSEIIPRLQEYKLLESKVQELPLIEKELDALKKEQTELIEKIQDLHEKMEALGFNEYNFLQNRMRLQQLKSEHERFSWISEKIKEIPILEESQKNKGEEVENLELEKAILENAIKSLGFNPQEDEDLREEKKRLLSVEDEAQKIALKVASEAEVRIRLQDSKNAYSELGFNLANEKNNLIAIEYVEENHFAAKLDLEQGEALLENLKKNLSDTEVCLGILNAELERHLMDAQRKKDYERKLSEISHSLQVVDTTRSLINRFMDYILIKIRDEISQIASGILKDITGKYDTLSIDDNFNITVEDDGKPYPMSRYSGGEIDMIAVSIRIAISEYLMTFGKDRQGCSFLILDEIFGSQDVEHRDNMIDMLRQLQERFPQIIVISHISDVHGQFDHTILVGEDETKCSYVEVS
ncbi:MAG: SMC family ATPase [Methanothrix sp.]|nr:SMC family ATPase [Methanothrix sp.]MDD4446541.1 SMC family ATPase [Methanothrix sp.]